MNRELLRQVREQAGDRCEYCQMPRELDPTPFQVDHVVAQQHGGETVLENLAWSCLHCNKHKGPNVAGVDPQGGQVEPLFHPRRQQWSRHFRWRGAMLIGLTKTGRATVRVLAINDPDAVAFRTELTDEGVYLREDGER